jgi:hypothetical protein
MKNINSIFGLILTLISFNSCKTEVPVLHQKILFEQHYVNYAWSYQNSGYLVDSLGYVRVFNLSKDTIKWNEPDKDGTISVEQMTRNLELCTTLVGQIDPDTISYYSSKIWAASKGNISAPQNIMADAGSNVFSAFIFDNKTNKYQKVMLKTWGDWTINNDAPEAESIYSWMTRINTLIYNYNQIIEIKYGTSFGECIGYCKRDLVLESGKVTYNCSGWNANIQPITRSETLTLATWSDLKYNLNINSFFELPATIGCPDCADGGAEWIEIRLLNGNTHKVTYEYNHEPDFLKSNVSILRQMLQKNECK